MGLIIQTSPVQEPVTLEDLSQQVRVASSADYARLTQMGVAAREWCEAYLNQQLCTATYLWTVDRFINLYVYQAAMWTQQIWPWQFQSQATIGNRLPNTWWTLWPPRNPVQSVTSIHYVDLSGTTQLLSSTQYLVDTTSSQCRISPAFGQYWPPTLMRQDAVSVVFVAGYTTVPSAIRLAICQLAAHWFDQREAVSFDSPTVVPMAVTSLLDSYATGNYLLP